MRRRLTLAFVLLSLALVLGVLFLRFYTVSELLRAQESSDLRHEAELTAQVIEQHSQLGQPVDEEYLATLVTSDRRIEYVAADGAELSAEGAEYAEGDGDDDLIGRAPVADGEVTLLRSDVVLGDVIRNDPGSVALLMALVALLAGVMGFLVSRVLSAPFLQLASAAEQLGRGRFDLDLPRTKVPEAQAISTALQTSAGQLQERLAGDRAFAEHASHVLRTPLTGLRMELEELAGREDLPQNARDTAERAVGQVDAISAVAGDLVQLSRSASLVAGAAIPLRDLATMCAQSWADTLAERGRTLSAAVEGRLETTYTPGPVEHILDILRPDVLRRGAGAVRMVFHADEDGLLRISVTCAEESVEPTGPGADLAITQARTVVAALGGRLQGDHPHTGIEVLLPRR